MPAVLGHESARSPEAGLLVSAGRQRPACATAWYPRLEDYTYVALTNGIAFSPTMQCR